MTRQRHCPTCGTAVYRSHHCRASALDHAPHPINREDFDQMRDQARKEARAEAAAQQQLALDLDTP